MLRFIVAALAWLFLSQSAFAVLAISGTPVHNTGSAGTLAVTYASIQAGDLVVVMVTSNGNGSSGVSGGTLGAFTLRLSQTTGSANQFLEEWAAISTGALTNEVITATSNLGGFTTMDAAAISGAKTGGTLAAAFDGSALGTTGADPLISTSNANTMILGGARQSSTASPTAGAGYTLISGANFQMFERQIVSSTQTNLAVTEGTGSADRNACIADAVVQASGGGTGAQVPLMMFGVGP